MDIYSVLAKEKKCGYKDSAVFGGFAQYLKEIAEEKSYPSLAKLALDYEKASLQERILLWQEIKTLLADLDFPVVAEEANSLGQGEKILNKQAKTLLKEQKSLAPREIINKGNLSFAPIPIQYLQSIGPKRSMLLQKLGIQTIEDLLFYFPRDYQDYSQSTLIADLNPGTLAIIQGTVLNVKSHRPKPKLLIIRALIEDESGSITAIWFNQDYLRDKLIEGSQILIKGKVEQKYREKEIAVQDFQFVEDDALPQLLPIYPATEALNQKFFRKIMAIAWEKYGRAIPQLLPERLLLKRELLPRKQAVEYMHFPDNQENREKARRTLAYEELFLLQSAILKNGKIIKKAGISHGHPGREWQDFLAALPFALTQAQVRVIGEILADMEAPQVMARLLQGDVGSGKTVVAAAALYCNYLNGYQGALMAPTEILARQHYQSLQSLLEPLSVRIALLTGKVSGKKRGELLASLEAGEIDIIIGTHALIQEQVSIPCLGLAITDEQHRFGVMQRAALSGREGLADVLVMTATPIPRTLSLTLYGDLDISIIDELPPGRQPIKTYAVSYDLEVRIFAFLEKEIKKGRQIFIVCPLVEESEKLDLENAVSLYENLQKQIFPHRRLGLLHGKMKSKEKESIMDDFAQGNLDILVSTTVIEVGINIPNATVMLIREAQRFGLAQLHQLRGRIGRGGEQSYCILMNNAKGNIARERMRVLCQSNDGFLIAEEDLRLRGPGDFFGTRQHGLPELKTANLFTDAALLEMARNDVLELMEDQDFWQSEEMRLIHQYLKEKYQLLN